MNHLSLKIEPGWRKVLRNELEQCYFSELVEFISEEYSDNNLPIYPQSDQIFTALWLTPIDKVKVVIIGQDPYHGENQAEGLSFSVPYGVAIPPSLRNIYRELENDLKIPPAAHGSLKQWAKQGVLLLNATLTVKRGQPLSHRGKGWERFTDAIIEHLIARDQPIVFMLWGKSAQEKCHHIKKCKTAERCLFLTAAHPSPLSAYRGFFGCCHFSQANDFLTSQKALPIDWKLQ